MQYFCKNDTRIDIFLSDLYTGDEVGNRLSYTEKILDIMKNIGRLFGYIFLNFNTE